MEETGMKQVYFDLKQQGNDGGISNINEDHKVLFEHIEKLKNLVDHPENHQYATTILESFITHFLEHIIKEEHMLQQCLPPKTVQEHTLLHQNELNYLDDYLSTLHAKPTSQNILSIAMAMDQEFKNHIQRYDKDILRKIKELKH